MAKQHPDARLRFMEFLNSVKLEYYHSLDSESYGEGMIVRSK